MRKKQILYTAVMLFNKRKRPLSAGVIRFPILLSFLFFFLPTTAQYNTDRLIISGRIAYSNHDYVVAIQHFNNVLSGRPYLYEPWYYRGLCKLQLDDYVGAEADFNKAIELNPYVHEIFAARAESRIRQGHFQEALDDYEQSLKFCPDERGYWFNRAYCRFFLKDNLQAHDDLETIVRRWPDMNMAYAFQTEIYLNENDTATASRWLDRTLEHNPYDGNSWSILARLNMQRKNWHVADSAFTKAIHYQPRVVNNYMYRAMVRVNLNRLRQAMEDYDKAIDMDPGNFLSHYNRGLLRQQLGDDNRAIEDFNFVLSHEPNNLQALYNRALLLDRTGNYMAAIADYSRVIETFPNFWSGLLARAACYRRVGMTANAERDEFRVTKAQLDKHLGIQQRWSKSKLREMRKLSDIDVEKYDQWVVIDNDVMTPQYQNDYRGSVQNRDVETALLPLYSLSLIPNQGGINKYQIVDHALEQFTIEHRPHYPLYVMCRPETLGAEATETVFAAIDTLTASISASHDINTALGLLLQRAVAHATTHNFAEATNDLGDYLSIDSTSVLALWQRAYCLYMMVDYDNSSLTGSQMRIKRATEDLNEALLMDAGNAILHYNIATIFSAQMNYDAAIGHYTQAIQLNPNLAEAHYNLGLTRIFAGQKNEGIQSLSKAGELGLYDAYSLIKRYTQENK